MPPRTLIFAPRVDSQIDKALRKTLQDFGPLKLEDYRQRIEAALQVLATEAEAGRNLTDIAPDAWYYHLDPRGTRTPKARHAFLYRISDARVEVVAFCYDGMDLRNRWRRWGTK
jgi:plasmid stabilization system protein ParE